MGFTRLLPFSITSSLTFSPRTRTVPISSSSGALGNDVFRKGSRRGNPASRSAFRISSALRGSPRAPSLPCESPLLFPRGQRPLPEAPFSAPADSSSRRELLSSPFLYLPFTVFRSQTRRPASSPFPDTLFHLKSTVLCPFSLVTVRFAGIDCETTLPRRTDQRHSLCRRMASNSSSASSTRAGILSGGDSVAAGEPKGFRRIACDHAEKAEDLTVAAHVGRVQKEVRRGEHGSPPHGIPRVHYGVVTDAHIHSALSSSSTRVCPLRRG